MGVTQNTSDRMEIPLSPGAQQDYVLKNVTDSLVDKGFVKINVQNINCTKIKSKLSRTYTDRHGLKDLIKEFIGVGVKNPIITDHYYYILNNKLKSNNKKY